MTTAPLSSVATVPPVATTSIATIAAIAAGSSEGLAVETVGAVGVADAPAADAPAAPPSAVEVAVKTAAGRQGGLASLLADLTVALQSPDLPQPVLAAAARVLSLQLPLDPPPTAADLRQALAQSGLLLEAQLAASDEPPGPDLKAALLQLRQALEAAQGGAPVRPGPLAGAPAPPYRGGPLRGQPPVLPGLAPDASEGEAVHRLVQQTAGALARQVLLQAASLAGGPRAPGAAQGPHWLFEIPLATPQGSAVAQFEIARDGAGGGSDEDKPVWRAQFSLNVEPMGAVHAKIALNGGSARVILWAERGETVQRLRAREGDLSSALIGDDLVPSVAIYPGAPSVPAPAAGQFVDQAL